MCPSCKILPFLSSMVLTFSCEENQVAYCFVFMKVKFCHFVNFFRFEIAIFVLIFLNMLSMGIEHYNQHRAVFFVLQVSNAFFTTVFALGKRISHT